MVMTVEAQSEQRHRPDERHQPEQRHPLAPPRRRLGGAYAVWALLVAATIPWRSRVYYEGGADPVVLAKGLLSVTALLLAWGLAARARDRLGVPASPILLVFAYLGVSLVGAHNDGMLGPAAVLAVRVAIVAVTVSLLLSRYSPADAAASLVHVLGVLVAAAALSGLPAMTSGRLAGAVPPMNPNELALMAGVCFLWCLGKMLTGTELARDLVVAAGCLAVVFLTGSRTGLVALCVAALAMALRATALTRRSFALVTAMAPVVAVVVGGSDALSSLFSRGGEREIGTLTNRTIAWDAALTWSRGTWDTWFGAGLTQKRIEVPGQWWTVQLLDSSWISAFVQTGLLGLTLVVALAASTVARSLRLPRSAGPFWLGAVVFLCLRGFLESGLFDSTTAFLVLFLTALACRGVLRDGSRSHTEATVT